jgi:hypothetical protein
MEEERLALLELWHKRSIRATIQHYNSAHMFRVFDSTLTGTNVIATISVLYLSAVPWFLENRGNQEHFSLAVAALITVITSTLQYILDYRTRWKAHERSGKGYGCLNREIEYLISTNKIDDDHLRHIRGYMDRLTEGAPTISWPFWNRPRQLTAQINKMEKRSASN